MDNIIIRNLGRVDYQQCWQQMKNFTETRDINSIDEIWIVEHDPIFTLGLAGKEEHLLNKDHSIPIIRTDRGGQVTYHGPNQIIIYLLINIKRLNLPIRDFVTRIENGVIEFLANFGITANSDRNAPGVYVSQQKIASLGLKIRRGCSYHGLSFNFAIDKTPFSYINPCGYAGLKVINLLDLSQSIKHQDMPQVQLSLAKTIIKSIYQNQE